MLNLADLLLFHFLLTTTVLAYSDDSIYRSSKSKGEQLYMQPRSSMDAERSTRRVFSKSPIRFGGRSDIPPLLGKAMEYESLLNDDMERERRALSKLNSHMRFGRANSNFIRFGRSKSTGSNGNRNDHNTRLTRANNSLFLRFGRGNSDFLRFGRSEEYLRKKRDAEMEEEKRGTNSFMRFGRRYEDGEYPEDFGEETLENRLQSSLLLKLLMQQVPCNMASEDCERLD